MSCGVAIVAIAVSRDYFSRGQSMILPVSGLVLTPVLMARSSVLVDRGRSGFCGREHVQSQRALDPPWAEPDPSV